MIRSYWPALAKGMVLGVVLAIVGVIAPFLTKLLIDDVYPTGDVTLMHVLVGGVLAVAVASALMRNLTRPLSPT
jgi:ATP-binding cassette subfamily B protein